METKLDFLVEEWIKACDKSALAIICSDSYSEIQKSYKEIFKKCNDITAYIESITPKHIDF